MSFNTPMKFTAKILTLLALIGSTSFTNADITTDVGVTSEFVRDGISQTGGNPALQLGLTATHHLGFYAGAWASTIDHRDEDDLFAEADFYTGINFPIYGHWSGDASISRYTFHGDSNLDSTAYNEQTARLLWKNNLTLGYRYTDNYYGSSFAKAAYELAYTIQTDSFSIEMFTAQHRLLDTDNDTNFGSEARTDDYWHFRVAAARSYNAWDYRLTLERTNLGKEFDGQTSIQLSVHRYFNIW